MSIARIVAIALVFGITVVAWMGLGGLIMARTSESASSLDGEVEALWGQTQRQYAPEVIFHYTEEETRTRTETVDGKLTVIDEVIEHEKTQEGTIASSDIKVDMVLDQRRKGLLWYSLYDLDFKGDWTYIHRDPKSGRLDVRLTFPDSSGVYDAVVFEVNGEDVSRYLDQRSGSLGVQIDVAPGDVVSIKGGYLTRGRDEWSYQPGPRVNTVENFDLTLTTNFKNIDFPRGTLSPSSFDIHDDGAILTWTFEHLISGFGAGVVAPTPIQPGQLASELAFSAPFSLFFFFLVIFVLATTRGINIHPINYLFLASAFFAFHLLFAYSVDHIAVIPAFVMASLVSIALVVSYLRLVVSSRFAFVEAGLAQLVYLVGFSLAHFWEGYTGLTVTALSIITLFILMQLTGRTKWGDVLGKGAGAGRAGAGEVIEGV